MTGQGSVQFNLPATVENSGWEFQIETKNIRREAFEWKTSFNITIPDNKLIAFPDIEIFPSYNNRYDVGKSVYAYKAFEYTGVNAQTGLYTFRDQDGDGVLSATLDNIALRETNQKYYGGVNNSFTYQGITLDIFFQFVSQTGRDYMDSFSFPGDLSNQPVHVMKRWQKEGDITDVQRFTVLNPDGNVGRASSNYRFSDQVITDASFIRLKNISLSWRLPSVWTHKAKIESSSIFIQGQNLFTFTNYIGYDPESMTSSSLPPLRVITAGIQLKL
jgi:hypothetical protein